MSEHVYKTIEVYGSSKTGLQQAIEQAVAKAGKVGPRHAVVPDDRRCAATSRKGGCSTGRWG
jgi:hypothetical protein